MTPEVLSRFGETERAIRPTTNHVGIGIVLPVVFPSTDFANLEGPAL
jgi:hypothetical protein